MAETIKTILTADSSDLVAEFNKAGAAAASYQAKQQEGFSKARQAHYASLQALSLEAGGFKTLATAMRSQIALQQEAAQLAGRLKITETEAIGLIRQKETAQRQLNAAVEKEAAARARAAAIANPRATGLPGGGELAPLTPQSLQAIDRGIAQNRELRRQTLAAGKSGQTGAMGFLAFSQAVEDSQYGIKGVLNNIPQMVMGFGGSMGVAGALSLAAVAGVVAYGAFEKLSGISEMTAWAETSKKAVDALTSSINANARETADLKSAQENLSAIGDQRTKSDIRIGRDVEVDASKYKALDDAAAAIQRQRAAQDAASSAQEARQKTISGIQQEIQALKDLGNAGPPDYRKPIREEGKQAFDSAKLKYLTDSSRATEDLATAEKNLITVGKDWERTRSEAGSLRTGLEARKRDAEAAAEEARRMAAARTAEKASAEEFTKAAKPGTWNAKSGASRVKDLEDEIAAQKRLQEAKTEEIQFLDQAIAKTEAAGEASLQTLSDKRAALKQEIEILHEQGRTREEIAAAEIKGIQDIAAQKLQLLQAQEAERQRAADQAAAPARADLAAEMQAMELRRSGQSAMAAALTEENALRKEAAALAQSVNTTETAALQILRDKKALAEETRLIAGGLSVRTEDRQQKRDEARQTKIEDARLRNRKGDNERAEQARKNEENDRKKGKDVGKPVDVEKFWTKQINLQETLVGYFKQLGLV